MENLLLEKVDRIMGYNRHMVWSVLSEIPENEWFSVGKSETLEMMFELQKSNLILMKKVVRYECGELKKIKYYFKYNYDLEYSEDFTNFVEVEKFKL